MLGFVAIKRLGLATLVVGACRVSPLPREFLPSASLFDCLLNSLLSEQIL